MPMERLNLRLRQGPGRGWAAGGFAVVLMLTVSATGCRSTRSEVPPGRGYSPETGQPPPVSFSQQPNANALNGLPGAVGTGMPGPSTFGTPAPGSAGPYGAPTGGGYGPPGSSGLGVSPSVGAATGAGIVPSSPAAPAGGAAAPGAPQPPGPNPF